MAHLRASLVAKISPLGRSARRWPWGMAGALLLVGLVEARLARRALDFSTIWSAAWMNAGTAARTEATSSRLLFFGDSLVMQGVVPRVIQAETGQSAYNLAVFKGLAPASYSLLRSALDAGAKPSAVFIDAELLADNPAELTRLWPELISAAEAPDLAWTARDLKLGSEVALAKLLGSLRRRYEIREALTAALDGRRHEPRFGLRAQMKAWSRNLGANLPKTPVAVSEKAIQDLETNGYWPGEWLANEVNRKYLDAFIHLAEGSGARVYLLVPPVHPEVQRRRDGGGLTARFDTFLRRLLDRHPGLTVLDGRRCELGGDAMADLTHLNPLGAVIHSTLLGRALNGSLGPREESPADRWVLLEPCSSAVRLLAESRTRELDNLPLREAARPATGKRQ